MKKRNIRIHINNLSKSIINDILRTCINLSHISFSMVIEKIKVRFKIIVIDYKQGMKTVFCSKIVMTKTLTVNMGVL